MTAPKFPLADAQVQTTLASIAYAGDTLNGAEPTIDQLHAAINHQLSCRPHYATKNDWHLVWGPVESYWDDNLVFATYNAQDATLAISIRGTTTQTLSRFEDVPRYQMAFPKSMPGSRVSGPFLAGLTDALKIADKWTKKTFADFFADYSNRVPIKRVVVNGHSQGAALVPMMMVALQQGLIGAPKVTQPVSGFAVAPPTSGNSDFADLVNHTCDCWFIVNPKDVVPLGYNAMMDVVTDGIPEELYFPEKQTVETLIEGLNLYVRPKEWAQPTQRATLEAVTLIGEGFFAQIGDQHNHNAYLAKLGAPETDVGDPSAFAVSKNPVITT